jgi:hypothetical protein
MKIFNALITQTPEIHRHQFTHTGFLHRHAIDHIHGAHRLFVSVTIMNWLFSQNYHYRIKRTLPVSIFTLLSISVNEICHT